MNVAVLSAASIFIINSVDVPAVMFVNVNVVLSSSVIVWTGASVASTFTLPEVADIALIVSFGVWTSFVNFVFEVFFSNLAFELL